MEKESNRIGGCRVCGSANTVYLCETYNEHSNTRILEHRRYAECGSVFVSNDIGSEELGIAYSDLDSTRYYEEIESENREKIASAIRNLRDLSIPESSSIIDIGAGNGLFIELLHQEGFTNLSAHEIPGANLQKIHDFVSEIYQDFDYTSIPSGYFDIVTLLDVVEHVMDPRYLVQTCHRILKPGGLIYFHTPVVTNTDRMMHFMQKLPVLKKPGIIWVSFGKGDEHRSSICKTILQSHLPAF